MLEARTIAEAYIYIEVTLIGRERADYRRYSTVAKEDDSWVVRFDGPYEGKHHRIELAVPVDSEARAEQLGRLTYGQGRSTLIDAGQWGLVELGNAAQAEAGMTHLAGRTPDREWYLAIRRAWSTADAAAAELAKFIPPDADQPPPTAFWTPDGLQLWQTSTELFGRARIAEARARYQREWEEFGARYRPAEG
ncbi:hypothetical protein GCM10023322_57950 [Rugosimonospora acidiphila]|uniref:Uncharacterized protein n=1 Tax=Rugosimonospora acidiphila TaxID=556531 RepID=A0ABP9SEW7_9ACTN